MEKGGKINDSEAVWDITPGSTARVRTSKASYTCDRLIITAGPWAPKLLKPIGLNIPLQVCIQMFKKVVVLQKPTSSAWFVSIMYT